MNTDTTIESFSNYLLPFIQKIKGENYIVLMDGARCHTSQRTQSWLNENKINYIPYGGKPIETINGYPLHSPDLNPIENVFSYWQDRVSRRNPKTIEQLIKIVKEEWSLIPLKIIRNCIHRLSKVMIWVDAHNEEYYNE